MDSLHPFMAASRENQSLFRFLGPVQLGAGFPLNPKNPWMPGVRWHYCTFAQHLEGADVWYTTVKNMWYTIQTVIYHICISQFCDITWYITYKRHNITSVISHMWYVTVISQKCMVYNTWYISHVIWTTVIYHYLWYTMIYIDGK